MTSIWRLSKGDRRPRHYAYALLRADQPEAARLWADAPPDWHALIATHCEIFSQRPPRPPRRKRDEQPR